MSAILFFTLAVCFGLANCSGNNMVCRPVEDACAEDTRQHLQGPPGKLGPKGIKGEIGLPGVKGQAESINYTRIEEEIDAEVNSATLELNQKLDETNSKLEDVIAVLGMLVEDAAGCRMRYKGTCYRALIHSKYDVPHSKALNFCQTHGMEPAEIVGEDEYNKIMECVRAEIPSETTFADIFTGMSYNPSTGIVSLSNGTRAPFVKWYENYPNSDSGRIGMGIVVRSDVDHSVQGMYNVPHITLQGIVCQKKNC